jgi:hypothetical protein
MGYLKGKSSLMIISCSEISIQLGVKIWVTF